MKIKLFIISLVLTFICAQAKEINPALLYYQAILLQEKPADKINEQIDSRTGAGSPEARDYLRSIEPSIKLVHKASEQSLLCDWGIDFSDGPETWLPQLAPMKVMTQRLCATAVEHLKEGKETDALRCYKSALYLGRNVTIDPILISALVGYAIENIVVSSVATNFHRFSNESLIQLSEIFISAPRRNKIAESLKFEKSSFLDWATDRLRRVAAAEGEQQALAAVKGLFENEEQFQAVVKEAGGSVAGLIKLHEQTGEYYDEAERIVALPYLEFLPAVKTLQGKIASSGNPVLKVVFPAISKAYLREVQTAANSEMLRAAIFFKLQGPEGLSKATNPVDGKTFALSYVPGGFNLVTDIPYGTNQTLKVFYPLK